MSKKVIDALEKKLLAAYEHIDELWQQNNKLRERWEHIKATAKAGERLPDRNEPQKFYRDGWRDALEFIVDDMEEMETL